MHTLMKRPTRWRWLIAIISMSTLSSASTLQRNDDLKIALIYQFAKYTRWPASDHVHMTFCTLGAQPFHERMNQLMGKKVAGKTISSRHLVTIEQVATHQCQVIYIADSYEDELGSIFSYLSGKPILTVSAIEDFTLKGGMINFVDKAQKQRFEISRRATQKTGLSLSSKLLQVAHITD